MKRGVKLNMEEASISCPNILPVHENVVDVLLLEEIINYAYHEIANRISNNSVYSEAHSIKRTIHLWVFF